MAAPVRIEFANVQALILQGYTHPYCRHLLFEFTKATGARTFLAGLIRRGVTSAAAWAAHKPSLTLNVSLSFEGLKAAQALSPAALDEFPLDFQGGPTPDRLHDVGPSAIWWNGVPTQHLHSLVTLHADDEDLLAKTVADIKAEAAAEEVLRLDVRPDHGDIVGQLFETNKRELHFGYTDGISAPEISWNDPIPAGKVDFRRYLLGYATDAIQSTPMPLTNMTPALVEAITFARDGTYLAFRLMYQDVAAFNRFLNENAKRLAGVLGKSHDDTVEWLAAKLLGRWRSGEPLILAPDRPNAQVARSDAFDYRGDPHGEVVPFSAHIRVVNPRDEGTIDAAHRPIPRVLRRGMPYGPPLKCPGLVDDGQDRGLIGMFLCNSLSGEFAKLLDWINHNDFSSNFDGSGLRPQDPLVGNRDYPFASKEYLIPGKQAACEAVGLSTFVQTRGTAYFLMPSLNALRKISGAS